MSHGESPRNPPPTTGKGCDDDCSIPSDAFDGDKPNLGLIEHCRLSGLPDLNQTEPFVRSEVTRATRMEPSCLSNTHSFPSRPSSFQSAQPLECCPPPNPLPNPVSFSDGSSS